VPALRQAGIPVGIGTDGAASNDSQNMLEAVKSAALLQKVARLDPRALTAGDVLAMATVEGARALGLERRIGSLEPGKRADVVRLRGDRPGLANVHDPRQQVVYCTSPSDVADVWVDGARRVMDGHLVDHDLEGLVEASRPPGRRAGRPCRARRALPPGLSAQSRPKAPLVRARRPASVSST